MVKTSVMNLWIQGFLKGNHPTNFYVGVSKNRDTPKKMVYIMENPIKMDDLVVPLFLETPMYFSLNSEAGFQTNLCQSDTEPGATCNA